MVKSDDVLTRTEVTHGTEGNVLKFESSQSKVRLESELELIEIGKFVSSWALGTSPYTSTNAVVSQSLAS